MKKTLFIILSVCFILLFDHAADYAQGRGKSNGFEKLYRNAVADASDPEPSEISGDLISISKNNPKLKWEKIENEDYVLVVSWKDTIKNYSDYLNRKKVYDTEGYEIWVTVVPELQDVCTREGDSEQRVYQRLGLPMDSTKKIFVEFWVKPSDLFRPCPDKEITDKECQLCFPSNVDSSYRSWFNALRANSYSNCNPYKAFPWTQLGYTYDWNPENKSHVGMSEFVIGKNKLIWVGNYYKTEDYCRKKK